MRPSSGSTASRLGWTASLLLAAAGACAKPRTTSEQGTDVPRKDGLAAEGAVAPAIEATAHTGEHVSLAALRGKPVVLYFYPRDDTTGCTKEACEFRDAWTRFKDAGAVILGVSTDDAKSHVAFADKYHLPFLLLPDENKAIANAYGVPVHLGFDKRVTFVIDPQGRIARVFPAVNPTGHAAEILAALGALHATAAPSSTATN
jgi:peroxiredoxin Q/BCP